MRLLANENLAARAVRRLRAAGHDVAAVADDMGGASDRAVMARAVRQERLVLTFDRDYGELVFRRGIAAPAGVVYFRYAPAFPEEPAEHLLALLALGEVALQGRFTVVERDRIRQRPLPPRTPGPGATP